MDFSYRVGKNYKLVVVADAKYYHYSSHAGQFNYFIFGKSEVLNRLYFVRKNKELSILKCYFSLILRAFLNLALSIKEAKIIYFDRFCGNIVSILGTLAGKEGGKCK